MSADEEKHAAETGDDAPLLQGNAESPRGATWLVTLAVALLAFIVSFWRHLPTRTDDIVSIESVLALSYQQAFADSWDNHGFRTLQGKPVFRLPSTQDARHRLYANHPPLSHWLIYLGTRYMGKDMGGLRSMPIVMTALTAFMLALFAARKRGAWAGVAAGLVYATLPMTFFFGRGANFETFVACLGTASLILAIEARSRWALAISSVFWALTALTDWVALFLTLSLLVLQITARPKLRGHGVHSFFAVLAGFALYGVLLSIWVKSPFAAIDSLTNAAGGGILDTPLLGPYSFSENQFSFWFDYFTPVGMVIAAGGLAVGLSRSFSRTAGPLTIFAMTWSLTAVINVAVFLNRSKDHEFWWFYASPAIAIFAGMFIGRLSRVDRALSAVVLIILVAVNTWGTVRVYDEKKGNTKVIEDCRSRTRFGADTLVLDVFKGKIGEKNFSPEAAYLRIRNDLPLVHSVIRRFMRGEIDKQRLVVWYGADLDRRLPIQLQFLILHGGKHETDGETSILIFERD